jgi:hypothetical protein
VRLDTFTAVQYAERVVETTFGDRVSAWNKGKRLNKFGRNRVVGTSYETVAEFQGATANETFVPTNLIDSISSSAAGDTGLTYTIEGHTIDGSGSLTFVIQDATTDGTDGRTEVALATPLARATRLYLKASGTFDSPQTAHSGTIYVYDNTDGITNGVPDTDAATKILLLPGEAQSEKGSTSISSNDYWFISHLSAGIGDAGGSAGLVTVRMETLDVANGGVWRPMGREIVLTVGDQNPPPFEFDPYLIVPKNHDWRIRAKTDTNTAEVFAEAGGFLASVRG